MATIRASAQFTSFKINEVSSRLQSTTLEYQDILNGGEVVGNTLQYDFRISGLQTHTIKSITINSLLFNSDGSFCGRRPVTMSLSKSDALIGTYSGNFNGNESVKTIISEEFKITNSQEETESNFPLTLTIETTSENSFYYGLSTIIISLQDTNKDIRISFSGPLNNRTPLQINVSTLLINQGAEDVTFSKDPTQNFNDTVDNVEGRMYLRQDGIYVDGYQYGIVAPATEQKAGVVKLSQNSFQIDEDGGIIAPTELGTAATPQLVFNAVATLKNYTDVSIAGILAPNIYIEEEIDIPEEENSEETRMKQINERQLLEKVTFSQDFQATEDNKININWLEII